jgi:hypothetical protein
VAGKEDKMTDINKINDEALENVTGGKRRTVHNDAVNYANLRESPNGAVVGRVYNGESVYTTGAHKFRGDYEWYEVEYDGDYYWIAGSLIGL